VDGRINNIWNKSGLRVRNDDARRSFCWRVGLADLMDHSQLIG